jgi:predicted anti-sigma-YlaC factor YlaD
MMLVGGGLATMAVAAFPQPARGNSVAHTIAAAVAFTALATWPAVAAGRRSEGPLLTRPAAFSATAVMAGLLLWFVFEVHGSHRGLAERTAAVAEALWPLAVIGSARTMRVLRRR